MKDNKQLLINLTHEDHTKIKIVAAQQGVSMKDLILNALDFYKKNVINK